MSRAQIRTVIFIVLYIGVGVAYDVWTAYNYGKTSTISWIISWSAQQWWGATLVLAFGILIGHFFAQDTKLSLGSWFRRFRRA